MIHQYSYWLSWWLSWWFSGWWVERSQQYLPLTPLCITTTTTANHDACRTSCSVVNLLRLVQWWLSDYFLQNVTLDPLSFWFRCHTLTIRFLLGWRLQINLNLVLLLAYQKQFNKTLTSKFWSWDPKLEPKKWFGTIFLKNTTLLKAYSQWVTSKSGVLMILKVIITLLDFLCIITK